MIRFTIPVLLLLAFPFGLTAQCDYAIRCDTAYVTRDLECCALWNYEAADRELNRVWQKVLAKFPPDAECHLRQHMITAQRAWITMRDEMCSLYERSDNAECANTQGRETMIEYWSAMTLLTRNRIVELQEWVNRF